MYRVYTTGNGAVAIMRFDASGFVTSFPCAADNADYQQFKLDIANGAELQDADGVVMTAEQQQMINELRAEVASLKEV